MSNMIPWITDNNYFNNSYGEKNVYEALKKLHNRCTVFHSIDWNFKNKSGTVRWGEADFVVFDPLYGLLVIEVKSGGIECNNNVIYQINTRTKEQKVIRPMNQAVRSKHLFIDLISENLDPSYFTWVEAAVWFPSINKKDVNGKLPHNYKDNVLYADDLNDTNSGIKRVFEFYQMNRKNGYEDKYKSSIEKLIAPQFSAIPSISNVIKEQNYYFDRLTLEQAYLLDYLGEQKTAAIQGAAGTGKTMIALEKAKRLSNDKVVFLCFNRLLIDSLKKRFSSELDNVVFANLYELASNALNKEANANDISDYLINLEEYLNWKFKHIIVDEGQDFNEDHIRLLHEYTIKNDGSFYVFYDKRQLVQQRNSLNWAKEIECRLVLSLNCRNTRSIAETAGKPIGFDRIMMRSEIIGIKPTLYLCKSETDSFISIEKLLDKYLSQNIRLNQITILTLKTMETSLLSGKHFIGSHKIVNSGSDDGVFFTTARKFKGLESDVVIVIDLDRESFNNDEGKRLFYVATSRAKHYLEIVGTSNYGDEMIIAKQLTASTFNDPRISIMKSLKVKILKSS